MFFPNDIPDFPFPKPKELEKLEQLPRQIINAMTPMEVEEKIREAASSLAKMYVRHAPDANYEECFLTVSTALSETGGAIPGQLGTQLVGTCQQTAEEACRRYFPDERNG